MTDLRSLFLRTDTELPLAVDKARRVALAVEYLRSDQPLNRELRNAIAELMEEPSAPPNRPMRPPTKWYEVAMAVAEGDTVQQAADACGVEKRTAERGLAYYRSAKTAGEHDI